MRVRAFIVGVCVLSAGWVIAAAAKKPGPGAIGQAMALSPDKGRFRIVLNGAEIATEDFEVSPISGGPASAPSNTWVARGETRCMHTACMDVTGQLSLRADGVPLHYTWASPGKMASGTVDFDNGTAKTSITLGDKDPIHQDFKFNTPRVAVLDNNLFDQYALLGWMYDWNAKGLQTFSILIPQDRTPGTIDVESTNEDTLVARTPDSEIHLYFDSKHHLTRLEVPAARVVVIRQ